MWSLTFVDCQALSRIRLELLHLESKVWIGVLLALIGLDVFDESVADVLSHICGKFIQLWVILEDLGGRRGKLLLYVVQSHLTVVISPDNEVVQEPAKIQHALQRCKRIVCKEREWRREEVRCKEM